MAFFDDFTSALKQKWLQYYQLNHAWLNLQMELEAVETPDGGRRPPSYLILGILNALEPKLAQLMLPFAKLNPSSDALIDVLELHFDPDVALGNRPPGKVSVTSPAPSVLTPASSFEEEEELEGEELEEEEFISEPAVAISVTTIALSEGAIDELEDEMSLGSIEVEAEDLTDMALDDEFAETTADELTDSEDEDLSDMGLDDLGDAETSETSLESDEEFGTAVNVWTQETSEESTEETLEDFDDDDMTLDEFGETETTPKATDDEDLDAFGDINFDPFGEPATKTEEEEDDEWTK